MCWKDKRRREKDKKNASVDDNAVDSDEVVYNGEGEYQNVIKNEDGIKVDDFDNISHDGI